MVELYCELLLARAGVLDGLAFGEAGVRLKGRVREEMAVGREAATGTGIGTGQGAGTGTGLEEKKGRGGAGGFFGIFGSGSGSGSKQAPQAQHHPKQSTPEPHPSEPSQTQTQAEPEAQAEETYYLDSALDEAAISIFYAWSRFPTEVRELTLLRSLLADRYGKDFMNLASENKLASVKAPERLVKGLRVRPPSAELVESYLKEIARAYKVEWGEDDDELSDLHEGGGYPGHIDGGGGGGGGDLALDAQDERGDNGHDNDIDDRGAGELVRRASETAELTRATPPRGFNPHSSPVSVAPPGPRSDNPNPRVRVPDDKSGGAETRSRGEVSSPSPSPSPKPNTKPSPSPAGGGGGQRGKAGEKSGIPDVDELSRRFAALKR